MNKQAMAVGVRGALRRTLGLDVRGLAVFRVLLGAILLIDLIGRTSNLTAFYTDQGVWPRKLAIAFSDDARWSLHLASGSAVFQAVLFSIAAAAALGLMLGWRTRLMTVVSWVLLASLHSRNALIQNGGDTMLLLCLFWSMFLPLGSVYSLDARTRQQNSESLHVSVGSVAFLIQVAAIYLVSALAKTGDAWRDGSALSFALGLREMTSPLAHWLRGFPVLCQGLTHFTWYLECFGPVCLFIPIGNSWVRIALANLFIGFHVMTGLTMDLGLFPLIGVAVWIAILPRLAWDRVWRVEPRRVEGGQVRTAVRRWGEQLLALLCLLVVIPVNVSVALGKGSMPEPIRPLLYAAMLRQKWTMFSPEPSRASRWVRPEATLSDGTVVDVFGLAPTVDDSPEHARQAFENFRWRKYLFAMGSRNHRKHRDALATYLRRRANEQYAPLTVTKLEIAAYREPISNQRQRLQTSRTRLYVWPAPGQSDNQRRVTMH